ncbi:HesB/YadR/YfhF family protein [Bacillus sp. FJAT-22090]|uniref:HesB/YadR/YfhF family protein n=1 Tax=Bacillus sp. FJAT-22090 TaxID=1581038 RepID=UPI00119E1D00|nr:HesB/YadR/YfhF family protein [Bacillus sp. FJAT-22090]
MKIFISPEAEIWFQNEMEAEAGDTIRFYARYGGSSAVQDGFSLGVTKDKPFEPSVTIKIADMLFFIEERDEWYFDGHDLYVDVDPKLEELAYTYKKA